MPDVTIVIDQETGTLLVEESCKPPDSLYAGLTELLGSSQNVGCARPVETLPVRNRSEQELAGIPYVRVSGYYHNSLIEGPGRRTSVLFNGCDLACKGCWVPQLHSAADGSLIDVDSLADLLLDPRYKRDGVSILGGEPFLQPDGLLALVQALRTRNCPHILVYTGHTYEGLLLRAIWEPAIGVILDEIDALIDGPYVEGLTANAGSWTGSRNQRVIDMRSTRRAHRVVTASREPASSAKRNAICHEEDDN